MELYGSIQSISGSMTASVFTGSFVGDGSGLYGISASGVTGLNLSQIATGSVTASVSPSGLNINSNTSITGSLRVNGTIIAEQIDVTIYSSSVLYQSGSTRFGDSLDDNHNITGSVNITGSISLNGQAIGTGKLDETVFNTYTASNNPRVNSLEISTTSLNSFSNSINSFTTSVNSYTSSNNSRVSALEISSGSLNSFTGSINTTIKNKLDNDGVISGSVQVNITGTTGYSAFSSSIATTDLNQSNRLTSIEAATNSLNNFSYSINTIIKDKMNLENVVSSSAQISLTGTNGYTTFSSSLATTDFLQEGRLSSLETASGSLNTFSSSALSRLTSIETSTSSLNTFSSSAISKLNSLESASSSIRSDFNSYTSSNNSTNTTQNSRLNTLETTTGSLNSYTSSTNTRLGVIEGTTSSLNSYTSSTNTRLGIIESTTASLNSYTSSTNIRLNTIETATSSLNSFTSSINTTIKNKLNTDGVISGSGQIDITQTTNYTSFSSSLATTDLNQTNKISAIESTTASLNTFTSSANGRLNSLESTTGSLNSYTSSNNTRLGVIESTTSSLNSYTSSNNTRLGVIESTTSSLNSYTSSTNTRLGIIESTTASLNTFTSSTNTRLSSIETSTGSLNSFTSSTNTRLGVIESTTSSLNTYTSSNNTRLGVIELTTASLNTFTSSANGRLNALETASGSIRTDFNTFTSSYTTVSGSLDSRLDVLEAYSSSQQVPTASYAFRTTRTDVYCQNNSGYQINKGQVVRIVGAAGDNPLIATASYINDNNSANTLGIATENIANGANGLVITEGVLLGVNTSGMTAGDLIFLGATGSFINTAPIAPLHAVRLGEVLRVQQNNGSIYVRIDNGIELDEAHDVAYTNISQGDLLVRNGSGVWVNSKSLNGSYSVTGSVIVSGSQSIIGDQAITGSLYITQDLIIGGSSSIQHISSSVLNVADNIITVNAQNPGIRFGGLAVIDSGSSPQVSGSMLFDSANDQWIFVHQNQSTVTSSVLLMGPQTFNNLGNETYPTTNRLLKSVNAEHLGDSNITDTGAKVSINSNTEVTGTFIATGTVYGTNITAIESTTASLNLYTSSNNTTNNTQNSRLTSLESTTSSLNTFTSSAGSRLTSIETSTSSLNSFTSSTGTRLSLIETSTGSLNTFTSSAGSRLSSLEITSGSLNSFSSSTNTRLTSIEASTSSLNSYTSSTNTRLTSIETSTSSLNSYTSSTNVRLNTIESTTSSLNSYTSSNNTRLGVIENTTSSLNSYTSSTNTRLNSIETSTGSLNSYTSSNNTRLGLIETSTGSLNSFTSSTNTRLNSIETSTGSLNSFTNSINTTIKNRLNAENVLSSSAQVVSALPAGTVSGSSQVLNGTTIHSGAFFNGISVVSGSSQISFGGITGVPTGLVSGSSQITFSGISGLPTLVSGSSQITYSGLSGIPSGIVSGSSQITYSGISGIPSGIVSGSSQISFGSISGIPSGLVSGSSQISFGSISGVPSGLVSGSSQISFGSISGVPSGLVSGSSQIAIASTTGFSTYLDQAVKSGSTVTFNGITNTSTYSGSNIIYSTYNTATGRSNLGFSVAKTTIGNIHIQNGAGPANDSSYQAAITFQGGTASEAQAGIYVLNNNSYGTSMGFATTNSYSTGPQLFMTATNGGVVDFPRARPTYNGNTILDAANYTSYAMAGAGYSANQNLNTTSAVTFAGITNNSTYSGSGGSFSHNVGNPAGTTELFVHNGANTPVPFRMTKAGYTGAGGAYGILQLYMNDNTNGNGANLYFCANNSSGTFTEYGGVGMQIKSNTASSEAARLYFYRQGRAVNGTFDSDGTLYTVGNIYTNGNGTTTGNLVLNSSNYTSYAMAGAGYSANQNLNTSSTPTFGGLTVGPGVATGRSSWGSFTNANIILTSSTSDSTGNCGIEFRSGNNFPSDGAAIFFENNAGGGSERAKLTIRVENDQEDFIELRGGNITLNANTISGGGQNPSIIFQNGGSTISSISSSGVYNGNVSGTANNITAYTINQNLGTSNTVQFGSLGVGVSPALTVHFRGSNEMVRFENTSTGANQYCQLNMRAGSRNAYLWIGNENSSAWAGAGGLNIYTENGNMDFWTNAVQRVRIQTDGHMVPIANNAYDLGSASLGWRNVYTNDLHLSNMNKPEGNDVDGTNGNWTIQEGAENLYIINNNNGKKFKISLEEIK